MIDARNAVLTAFAVHAEIKNELGPPEDGRIADQQLVVLSSLVRGTRGYIESIANQINGCYQNGWYDGCAVLLRRLLETLIIEAFEAHKIDSKIKDPNGSFFFLRDLIDKTLSEKSWNIGRNTRQSLPRLKQLGDQSAHSRRYLARKGDLQPLLADVRIVIQELVFLSRLK